VYVAVAAQSDVKPVTAHKSHSGHEKYSVYKSAFIEHHPKQLRTNHPSEQFLSTFRHIYCMRVRKDEYAWMFRWRSQELCGRQQYAKCAGTARSEKQDGLGALKFKINPLLGESFRRLLKLGQNKRDASPTSRKCPPRALPCGTSPHNVPPSTVSTIVTIYFLIESFFR
jgi:hypothetical protein